MFYRPEARPESLTYNPFKALVSPRPIAWVSTVDAQGRPNLAPFSYFNAVGDAPPVVMIAPNGPKPTGHGAEGEGPDTLRNILDTEEFVVNLVGADQRDLMNATSAGFPHGVDEFAAAGVQSAPSEIVAAPRVADSAASLECRFLTRTPLPSDDPSHDVGAVFGQVVGIHINDAVIENGRADVLKWRPLARLGYRDYAAVTEVFQLNRPSQR